MVSSLVWTAPGPGTWERDQSHFSTTVSRLTIEVMEQAAPKGMREGSALIGAPIDTMEVRFVNGQMYRRLVPVIGGSGKGPSKPPPAWLVRAVFAVHPRLRRRAQLAGRALEAKSWRAEADRWDSEWKPTLVATNRRLGRIDLGDLTDSGLADHLDACLDHLLWSTALHFRLHVSDLGPIAVLLDRTTAWGIDPGEVMAALTGSSPATSGPRDALRPLARELADRDVDARSFDDIRRAGEKAAELLDDYIAEYGHRLTTGYDLTDLTLAEMPEVVLASLRDVRLGSDRTAAKEAEDRGAAALSHLRSQVAATDLAQFDDMVEDARRLYGLRDENGPLTFEWPGGVLRLALLEAGSRFVRTGRLASPEHVFDLSRVELVGALRGEPGPRADAVQTRHVRRLAQGEVESPAHLGPAPVEPDLSGLPDAMQELMRMTLNVLGLLEAVPNAAHLTGTGIGVEAYRGTARVVADADEAMERAEPGDVIITRFTAPTFNSVLAMAGAVVTEQGGLLCHTAVIARELGIAAVVGASGALGIPDGSDVIVDPVAGTVTVV
jgi:rifampicin phosphotransferase